MTIPHRDDVARRAAIRPDHHHHPISEKAVGLIANFAIVLSIIDQRQRLPGKHPGRIEEIEPALLSDLLALGWVAGDLR